MDISMKWNSNNLFQYLNLGHQCIFDVNMHMESGARICIIHMVGYVLLHINLSRLFNAKSFLKILTRYIWFVSE